MQRKKPPTMLGDKRYLETIANTGNMPTTDEPVSPKPTPRRTSVPLQAGLSPSSQRFQEQADEELRARRREMARARREAVPSEYRDTFKPTRRRK